MMIRELTVFLAMAIFMVLLLIAAFSYFSSFWDIFTFMLGSLFMLLALMGSYIEYIDRFVNKRRG